MVSAGGGSAAFVVSMLPEDYKRLSPEVIAKIKPLTDDPETTIPDSLPPAVILPIWESR